MSRREIVIALTLVLGCSSAPVDTVQPIRDVNCVGDKCDGFALVPGVTESRAFPALSFTFPVQLSFSTTDDRAFVVEHAGTIRAFHTGSPDHTDVVLDLSARTRLGPPPAREAGLNGMAIDPQDREVMYVTYDAVSPDDPTNPVRMRWRLSRFTSSDGGATWPADSEDILIEMDKNADEHNAGTLLFGQDGFLYVSVGDGGPSFDPNAFGQNVNGLYGKILRLDVRSTSPDPVDPKRTAGSFHFRAEAGGGPVLIDHDTLDASGGRVLPYGIPADNPFATSGGRPEIYAWGLRNPWRMSFDRDSGDLWAGDVGQDAYEEIDLIQKGGNYGWGTREARHCAPGHNPCDVAGAIDPVVELQHGPTVNAVIGGFVYRGHAMPELRGTYVFANFAPGVIYGIFNENGAQAPEALGQLSHTISGFAQDADGELYTFDLLKGGIYKLQPGPDHAAAGQRPPFKFLMRAGIGSDSGARAYYQSIIPGLDPTTLQVNGAPFTLQQWGKQTFFDANGQPLPTVEAYYQNTLDLGFWREMKCTTTVARGVGGCQVRNWRNEGDKNPAGTGNLGTVTMDVSPQGFTRFYVFGPDGTLSPSAVLDSEGKKFVPELCTTCHGGKYAGAGSPPDLGSIFREWEPREDVFPAIAPVIGGSSPVLLQESAITRGDAQKLWAGLNRAAHGANDAIAAEAAGAVAGTDHAKAAMNAYIDALYASTDPVVLRAPDDPAIMPAGWGAQPGESDALVTAKHDVWVGLVSKTCMGCHRTNSLDLSVYGNFQALASFLGGQSVLEHYMLDNRQDPARDTTLYMPQAELAFKRLQVDVDARAAAHDWANQANSPTVPVCEVAVEMDGAAFTQPGQDLYLAGNNDVLGLWSPPDGVELAGTPINGNWTGVWRGSMVLPQGLNVQLKGTIVQSANRHILMWEPDFPTQSHNREFTVPRTKSASMTFTWGQ
jgi:glucose/arabinose dehydrogenase